MILRKLTQEEHGNTRPLWEEVFADDTKAFLDYYYYIKTRDNEIYTVEEDGQICSMLQLNPYTLNIVNNSFPGAYIIAVATREPYRGRGYMGALLRTALNDMYAKKMPFTFLMPAAEAIYTPYDFRFIYTQNIGRITLEDEADADVRQNDDCTFTDAALWDAEEMASFVNGHFAVQWQVYAERDAAYYQTMIMEQMSERGGVRLIRENGSLKGMYAYAAEGRLEIREPLYLPGYEAAYRRSVRELLKSQTHKSAVDSSRDFCEAVVYACGEKDAVEKKPVIMARIIRLEELLKAMIVPSGTAMRCSFAVIDPLIHGNSRVWQISSDENEQAIHVRETEDSEGVIPITALTEFLFGQTDIHELSAQEDVILSEHLAEELDKITRLSDVFLNEIV